MTQRSLGIDLGAETLKLVELTPQAGGLRWTGRWILDHHKQPAQSLLRLLKEIECADCTAAVTGRFRRLVVGDRVPPKQAQATGFAFLGHHAPATIVSIGSHGFSVLELRRSGAEVFRENSRCSQGTGNFLRQLVERFDLSIEEASALAEKVEDAAPLSGRCPVILKTDMTHLANKGEDRTRVLAGLFDAVCENVEGLLKPRTSPPAVALVGGVTRAPRVRAHFAAFLAKHGMHLLELAEDEAIFLDALGAACVAAQHKRPLPAADALLAPSNPTSLEVLPGLSTALPRVRRLAQSDAIRRDRDERTQIVLGFDIGSTGSKIVALDRGRQEPVWETYLNTNGNPIRAAQGLMQRFVESPAAIHPLLACAATGSGREIVGSLLATCFGPERVYVLNEIAAHAAGACHYDSHVDTIFEIGGQDAKYIRLAEGRVVEAAMNEACSAGTGSFIEEQGRKLGSDDGVSGLAREALASPTGVSLGQHCSVFMAEVIDEAVAAGAERGAIVAGLYDSVVSNYLNRVKGNRSVGDVIFCQGMPFSADALAAAVARETGSDVIVPPNPGTVGALGIALLAQRALTLDEAEPLDPARFLEAMLESKDTFVCKATRGCGGAGNRCRIDRLTTRVEGERQRFTWGGNCSLWDRGTGKKKLPDRAPDPFREREALVDEIVAPFTARRGREVVAFTDEFVLKSLVPFFAAFLHKLGFDLALRRGAGRDALARGIEEANVAYCAPMQQYLGVVSQLCERSANRLFLPMLRHTTRPPGAKQAAVCPLAQGSADLCRWDLGLHDTPARIVSPVIDIGEENLHSAGFLQSCERLATELGVEGDSWREAHRQAAGIQAEFERRCFEIGRAALEFCGRNETLPIVVLGRPYTIYNDVLNSNVPALLREQGALAIPVDCYPVATNVPVFRDIYWGHGQTNLRAAHQIRRSDDIYSIWCSNYSCGPDSFNLHFYAYIMEGRPFAVIETDGHSGDAGTKTRVEAFLHCVREDRKERSATKPAADFVALQNRATRPAQIRARDETVLVQRMGPGADVAAAALRGAGFRAECLPMPDREALRLGRRYTSGKECVPMCITIGSLLQRLERERESKTRFAYLMPKTTGPCRFGVYNLLHKIVLEHLGWQDRVRLWSPVDQDYGEGLSVGVFGLAIAGWITMDTLLAGLHHVRPVESRFGAAQAIFDRHAAELNARIEAQAARAPSFRRALAEAASGRLFGCTALLRRAGREYARVMGERRLPTAALVGEIYVRCDPFANDFLIEKLEERGLRVQLAPFNEWLEYAAWCANVARRNATLGSFLGTAMLRRTQSTLHRTVGRHVGWNGRTTVSQSLEAAQRYLRLALEGEAVLTLGGALHEWRERKIDGVVNVGPLECMPTKLAQAQFFHAAEHEGLPSVTLPMNGDPLDPELLDHFAYELHNRFEAQT